jgi:DNA-binding transcriptional MerR regulator
MVRIGDFARMGRVSIKALRYYDEIGLLLPAHSDGASGYRYYSASQLPLLNRLLVYKNLGFSLDQTRALLAADSPATEMHELLQKRREELERRLEIEQVQLAEVESRIRQIEREGRLPTYEALLKETEARQVFSPEADASGLRRARSPISRDVS